LQSAGKSQQLFMIAMIPPIGSVLSVMLLSPVIAQSA
jgi:hypothetical protein